MFFARLNFMFLVCQVEGVSYVEMSSKTDRGCEDQTLDQVSSHELFQELRKLPKADVAQDIRLINTNDKITANMNDKLLDQSKTNHSSAETDDLHIKVCLPSYKIFCCFIRKLKISFIFSI